MINLIISLVINAVLCAVVVKLLGGNPLGGLVAGAIFEIILYFIPLVIFPYSSIIIPATILAVLIYFLGKLIILKSIIAAILTYALAIGVGYAIVMIGLF
jgi:hypothetical protein